MNDINFGSASRKSILYFVIIAAFGFLGFRLFQLQILHQRDFDQKSAGNSIKAIEQIPFRGVFFDRNLKVLVDNIPAYTLRIIPADYDTRLNGTLEAMLELDSGYINKLLYNNRIYSKYVPIRVKRGIYFEVVCWLEENNEHLPGVDYIVEMQRGYPAGVVGSHLFGYAKEISAKLLEKEDEYYNPRDYVGYTGIEKTYEKELRGIKGFNYILVDSKQKEIGKFNDGHNDVQSIKGHDLVLSIDVDVQRVAEQELIGKRGAVVAIDPSTGEIIALVSSPGYDLNQFSYVTTKEFLDQLYNDPEIPLFNRATMSLKPPGSTYKILSAIAALDLGIITSETSIYCGGGFTFGRFFKCHGSHGSLNVVHAIEKSCNTFFYNLIYKIGLDNWYAYGKKFGFGEKTSIDIGEEVAGFIPNEAYYKKIYGEKWPRSIMASLSIGQGEVSVTPLQLAKYVALIANNGKSFEPHVAKGYLDDKTKQLVPFKSREINTNIKQSVFDLVKEGMFLVVNGSGTATSIRMSEIEIAGKTGTAQNPHGKDHAFFIGFAPYQNPKIAFAIVVENIGFGGTWAAPIAKKMIEAYLMKEKLEKKDKPNTTEYTQESAKVENAD